MAKKILVIDDDEGILDAFDMMLTSVGYEVKTTPDTEYLDNLTKDQLPNLILLDVLLSGKDGRDICRQLKTKKKTKKIPIIMVSAHPNTGKTIQEAGADDFIAKPFEMDNLLEKVAKYLAVEK